VADFHVKLAQAARAASKGEGSKAEASIDAAIAAVQGGPAFMIDAFDYLMVRDSRALAQRLVKAAAWPRSSSVASAKERQLTEGASGQ
jgi:hypothetical protein